MIDIDFPLNEDNIGKSKSYVWKSFNDYPLFIEQGSQFPKQGKLGNCYWIAPLVSIYAVKKQQIQSLFVNHDSNFTTVRLCIDGEMQLITVDHYFPFNQKVEKPAYSKLVDGAIWAMVLEKAWAKLYGSYSQIGGGFNRTTLKSLSGAPTNKFRVKDPQFDQIFLEIGQMHFPCGANSKKTQPDEIFAKNHAYSILEINQNNILVRNPWGKKNRDQHLLSWNEFKNRFASIECCYHFDNYQYESIKTSSQINEKIYFEIDIKQQGNYFFTINQKNKRWFRKQPNLNYQISPAKMQLIIGDIVLNQQCHQSNKELWINWNFLIPCKVYIVCEIEWQNINLNEFIFNTYGPSFHQKQVSQIILENNEIIENIGTVQFLQRDSELEQKLDEKNQFYGLNNQSEQQINQIPQVQTTITTSKDRKSCGYCIIQ